MRLHEYLENVADQRRHVVRCHLQKLAESLVVSFLCLHLGFQSVVGFCELLE